MTVIVNETDIAPYCVAFTLIFELMFKEKVAHTI